MRRTFWLLNLLIITTMIACRSQEPPQPAQGLPEDMAAAVRQPLSAGERRYLVKQELLLTNHGPGQPEKHNLWLALVGDQPPYQTVISAHIQPSKHTVVADEYGNQYAEFDLSGLAPGDSVRISAEYNVSVTALDYLLDDCQGPLPAGDTSPELHIESANPQITALAAQLREGGSTVCDQMRAVYDYVAGSLVYSYNGRNWGAQAALGEMGADCTEYASLMIALARANQVPARYLEGVLTAPDTANGSPLNEHAWLELYLPGSGWAPMDPTLGRSSLTRDQFFAAANGDRIIVTRGRSPSTLRGASYWSHLYWPGNRGDIQVEDFGFTVTPAEDNASG